MSGRRLACYNSSRRASTLTPHSTLSHIIREALPRPAVGLAVPATHSDTGYERHVPMTVDRLPQRCEFAAQDRLNPSTKEQSACVVEARLRIGSFLR